MLLNGLGQLGLLDRVSTDGSWWIHHARTEQFAVLQDGLLKSLRLTHTGAASFFTLLELMAANLRSLLSAYAGLWVFPAPADVPTDLRDPDVRFELRRRLLKRQGGRCAVCGLYFLSMRDVMELDHITPDILGGPDVDANVESQLVCPASSTRVTAPVFGRE